ncbi:MAG: prepilin-type N-terminal cleavage/methylation domain-containing protein [Planctomycetota bacterium]
MTPFAPSIDAGWRRRGLTLLELVVVLAILSALGTVMITRTTTLESEARYEQTVRTMDQLQDAIIGRQPIGLEDPSGVLPGFVADMGRLPVSTVLEGELGLSELWDVEPFAAAGLLYGLRTNDDFDDRLELLCGWRGPYVRLPVGATQLRDGWGREYTLATDAGVPVVAAGVEVGGFVSGGSGLADAFDPVEPLEVVLEDATRGINRVDSSLPLNALTARYTRPSGDTTTWAVARLYGVSGGRPELLAQSDPIEGDVDPAATFVPLQFNSVGATPAPITSITTTLGPKVLVLYQLPNSFAPPTVSTDPAANLGPDFAVPTDARPKSIVRFTVPVGGLNSVPSPLTLVVP